MPTRRTVIDRWIAGLNPLFQTIDAEVATLDLGEPRCFGPSYFARDAHIPEHVRRGAVWWLRGIGNCGFHVDFFPEAVRIEAWASRLRRIEVTIHAPEPSELSLRHDLRVAFGGAGLDHPEQFRFDQHERA